MNIWARNLLFVAGAIECIAGILHFFMPRFVFQSDGLSQLSDNEIAFVTLFIFAVGILLIAFGCITIVFSLKIRPSFEVLYYYLFFKCVLWFGRVLLEVLYPVKLNLFYIDPVTIVVLPGVVMEFLLFITSFVVVRKMTKLNKPKRFKRK